MIPKEILKQIRQIEIRTNKMVNDMFAGGYHSVFKGRGMEFDEVREYHQGDDIRDIDWNVTARSGKLFVKQFIEERQLTVILLIDASGSGRFGTHNKLKSEITAEIGAILAFSAIKNNDKVGAIIFTDQIEKFIPPQKGKQHILRIIRDILYFKPEHRKTNIEKALQYLNEVCKKRSIVFLISDFIDKGFEQLLHISSKKHDLVAITIIDPREQNLPGVGFMELEDAETGEVMLVNTRDKKFRDYFAKLNIEQEQLHKDNFLKYGIDNINILTDKPYIKPLIAFFRMRARRL